MKRLNYYNYIEEKLNFLAFRIESRGKLNILDIHLHSENFYLHFFNMLFGWKLANANAIKQNVEAIDLIDDENKVVVQVSATATKNKVESALGKDLSAYLAYVFKFISISKNADNLRRMKFKNPHAITFAPKTDIYDIAAILKLVLSSDVARQKLIFDFVKQELGGESDPQKLESNLAAIIGVLSKENFQDGVSDVEVNPYEVERKISFNKLNAASSIVEDYKIHYSRLDKIYATFDRMGANKSQSVLDAIRRVYLANKKIFSDDTLFFKVIECVTERIQGSANYNPIPYEELELCVNILVVDAFIRCKIFENPEKYAYVAS